MADSALLPYNLERFPSAMQETLETFVANNVTQILESNGASLKYIQEAVKDFKRATEDFLTHLDVKHDPIKLRIANDQMMQLERVFYMPQGLPGRPDVRNAIFAPAKFNSYGGSAFPGISDLLHEIDSLEGEAKIQRWKDIKRHLSDLMIMIQAGARFLKPAEQI